MKHIRRTTKGSDKTVSVSSSLHQSLRPKDAIAIVPPKKVIKALYDYQPHPPSTDYLGFSQGDFLHVVGRENDTDWYLACNPIVGTQGLVPANYFQIVGKNARNSSSYEYVGLDAQGQQPTGSGGNDLGNGQGTNHDSGYSEKTSVNTIPAGPGAKMPYKDPAALMAGTRISKTMAGKGAGNMVYGVVQYDFKAERPDELEAQAGEAIIVIAQSNSEWFVAKPIQRLGGPGLIPVSFIEIRDMGTGQAVADPHEAVRRAGVPKVEEWKRMAAEYKNSSIPIGVITPSQPVGSIGPNNLAHDMERMALNHNGQNAGGNMQLRPNPETGRYGEQTRTYQPGHSRANSYSQPGGPYGSNQYRQSTQYNLPTSARVPRYVHQREEYWFIVETAMADGRHWDLSRNYKDFYGLQLSLKENFPEATEEVSGRKRLLPYMPGPLPWVTDHITSERRGYLDKYIKEVLAIPQFSNSTAVKAFFTPRDGDAETGAREDLNASQEDADWVRLSQTSSQQSGPPGGDSRQSSSQNLTSTITGGSTYSNNQYSGGQVQQRSYQSQPPLQQPYMAQTQQPGSSVSYYGNQKQTATLSHQRSPSELRPYASNQSQQGILRQASNLTSTSNGSLQSNNHIPNGQSSQPQPNGPPVKIKVWFGDETCVVIRLSPSYTFDDLVSKLRERWSLEPGMDKSVANDTDFVIQWKDDISGMFYKLTNQDELDSARSRTEKLTLRVGAVMAV